MDATIYTGRERPGQHPRSPERKSAAAFGGVKAVAKPAPGEFLAKGHGLGGTVRVDVAKEAAARRESPRKESPPKAGVRSMHVDVNANMDATTTRQQLP